MGTLGWECSRCTFYHTAPGTRCVMCNELRVTKQQMLDFVQGKKPEGAAATAAGTAAAGGAGGPARPMKQIQNPYKKKPQSTSSQLSFSQNHSREDGPSTVVTTSAAPAGLNHDLSKKDSPTKKSAAGPTWPIRNNMSIMTDSKNGRSERNDTKSKQAKPKAAESSQPKSNPFTAAIARPPAAAVYQPGPVPLCEETAGDWIYPVLKDFPMRDYQRQISETAIFANTLVSLPTGLGKTLIAAVVLYNYYRWFPSGKIVFMAPTLPLVNQQVKACYDIMGIPAGDTAILTGKVKAEERTKLWDKRRVFFCTPQTVQKDLEFNRCCPKQLVCLVLDEAHKASGDYAYTQVVQLLETGGAKFRLVGLSATPGTNIKAIQRVVDTLHIHRIEARFEDDRDVKKYMHERHSEIIVVKNSTVASSVERKLSNLIGPLLDTLRQGGALRRISGNSTVVPYNIIQARDDYMKHNNNNNADPRLLGYFAAAQKLVQCRADLRTHGIGVLRNRLVRLKSEPNRGVLATIVKSDGFLELFEEIATSSYDPDSSQIASHDRKMNNPKLLKLDEILTEHFERSRACNESSRAIVFSQWRESVSEIVEVLSVSQPLLRPRHFVGQGKAVRSAKGKQKDPQPDSATNVGMKQNEQQQVIREFREGIHNVLVCTCIGEEGLDIGEVDLIVNYDTLRSPIRMIQRTGRTGRKRNGRVVCLVSEGHEERTFNQSKEAEVTLGRALKNASAFKLHPNLPMFSQKPRCIEQDMSVKPGFHMSQVGGHMRPTKQVRDLLDGKAPGSDKGTWQLSAEQEKIRAEQLGHIGQLQSVSSLSALPRAVLRNFLGRRQCSLSKSIPSSSDTKGLTRMLLHEFETKYCRKADEMLRSVGSSRGLNRDSFPFVYFSNDGREEPVLPSVGGSNGKKQTAHIDSVECAVAKQAAYQSKNVGEMALLSPEGAKASPPAVCQQQAIHFTSAADLMVNQVVDQSENVEKKTLPRPVEVNASLPRLHQQQTIQLTRPADLVVNQFVDRSGNVDRTALPRPWDAKPSPSRACQQQAKQFASADLVINQADRTGNVGNGALPPPVDAKASQPWVRQQKVNPFTSAADLLLIHGVDRSGNVDELVLPQAVGFKAAPPRVRQQQVSQFTSAGNLLLNQGGDRSGNIEEKALPRPVDFKAPPATVRHQQVNQFTSAADLVVNMVGKAESLGVEFSSVRVCPNQPFPVTAGTDLVAERSGNVESVGSHDAMDHMCSPPRVPTTDFNLRTPSDSSCTDTDSDDDIRFSPFEPEERERCFLPDVSPQNSAFKPSREPSAADSDQLDMNKTSLCKELPASPIMQLPSQEESSDDECTVDDSIRGRGNERTHKPPLQFYECLEKENEAPVPNHGGAVLKKRITAIMSPECQTPAAKNHGGDCKFTMSNDLVDTPEKYSNTGKHNTNLSVHGCKQTDSSVAGIASRNLGAQKKRITAILSPGNPVDHSGSHVRETPGVKTGFGRDTFSIDLVDTPESLSNTAKDHKSSLSALQQDDELRCAICLSVDFEENDPIIFCDGTPEDSNCNLGVHLSCYSIPLDHCENASWQCDVCKWKIGAKTESRALHPKCSFCQKGNGPLRLTSKGSWHHPYCSEWSTNGSKGNCAMCSVAGGVPCSVVGCRAAAHPHCAVLSRSAWSLVRVGGGLSSRPFHNERMFSFSIFCPAHESKNLELMGTKLVIKNGKGVQSVGRPPNDTTTSTAIGGISDTNSMQHNRFEGKLSRRRKSLACDSDSDSAGHERAEKRRRKLARLKSRRTGECYIENEAFIDSEEDVDGDEDESELARIDEEEALFAEGFINDSSQLGYTQDELDLLDPTVSHHRELDAARDAANLFATPLLNRRMLKSSDTTTGGQSSSASDTGLGKMHFIRSVLEHARQGGDADDIEHFYQQAAAAMDDEEDDEVDTEVARARSVPSIKPSVLKYIASDSEDDDDDE